jgi:hypothetical protein
VGLNKITFISVGGFYDHPLSGWLRVNTHYHYFELIQDTWVTDTDMEEPEDLEWAIYKIPKDLTLEHLRYIRKLRLIGGWFWDYNPHAKKTGKYKDNYMDIYKIVEKPRSLNTARNKMEMVGTTKI